MRRSVLIRRAIELLLAEDAAAAADAAIVAGYRRHPPPEPDAWVVDQARAAIASEPW